MKHRIFAAAIVASSLFTVPAMQAATLNLNIPVHAMGKVKPIQFDVQNNTPNVITLKAGDQQFTVEPGKSSTFKVPAGTQLVTVNAMPKHAAGDVIATADMSLSGSTLILN